MRANRLPAAVRTSTDRLEDLKVEAEFFAYDRLVAACDEAMASADEAKAAAKEDKMRQLEKEKEDRSAKSVFICVSRAGEGSEPHGEEGWGDDVTVDVPKGSVLFIDSIIPSFYNGRAQMMSLRAEVDGVVSTVASTFISNGRWDQAGWFPPIKMQQQMNMAIYPGENETVAFDARGASWCLTGWVGHPCNIPGSSL